MTSTTLCKNPYARKGPTLAHNGVNMGRQSQQRVGNQHKRKFKLAASHSFKKTARKGDQLTLGGEVAFQSERDCIVCKARSLALFTPGVRVPKRAHHQLCVKNKSTRGKGSLSVLAVAGMEDDKRYQSLTAPIRPEERGSWKYLTKEAGTTFFNPVRKSAPRTSNTQQEQPTTVAVTPRDLCLAVAGMVENSAFCEKHKSKSAPLAMIAFADIVSEKILQRKEEKKYFNGMTLVVPDCDESDNNPHYHSIIGQKLLLVDWVRLYGLQVPCADASCPGILQNDRTNFSKNKTLFPIFSLDGAPTWCIVMMMTCPCCHRRFYGNEGDVLINVPDYASHDYPVAPTYAQSGSACHLSRNATEVFSEVMLTYGNGDMCSKLMYNAINRAYIERVKVYYSRAKRKQCRPKTYLKKDGEYIKQFPPLGETVRSMYDEAASSNRNHWRISDFERNTREIQGVRCDNGIFTQDHTFEATKNYQKKTLGATAAWTVGTGTGEVAAAVLVKTTKTEDYAHAAQQLLKREHFNPKVMYTDTWPHKMDFWRLVCPGIEGRLGLFHFEKRIISTLRKTHIDYFDAISDLLASLYVYCSSDYEALLTALKEGTLSSTGKKYSSRDISNLKGTKLFRDRYAKYLRKQMHRPQTIIQMLDDWFCRYKVTSSDPINQPAGGRLDPIRMVTLFTADTKTAIENCKEKAKYLEDPLPLNEMYDTVPPNPNAPHKLNQYLSKRGESKLEAFHDRFAHYANCGMRNSLADNLNLAGTARYNLSIRHKRSWITATKQHVADERKNLPAAWERVVPYFNHTELWYVNRMAAQVGCPHPFPNAEVLPRDNGERFFSQYLTREGREAPPKNGGAFGECLCLLCTATKKPPRQQTKTATSGKKEEEQQRNTTTTRVLATDSALPAAALLTATENNEETTKTLNSNCQPAVALPPRHQHKTFIANSVNTYKSPSKNYCAPAAHQEHQRAPRTIAPAMLLPMTYQLPLYFVAPQFPSACCDKYQAWLTRRVGRPPHHPLCPQQKR